MSVLRLEYPTPSTCGHRAALDQPDGEHRRCRLDPGHPLPHVYPPLHPAVDGELGVRVCEVLGIDPAQVNGVSLHFHVNTGAEVLISRPVLSDELDEVLDAMASYRLVPR